MMSNIHDAASEGNINPEQDHLVLLQALDELSVALGFYDRGGALVHANRAFKQMLQSSLAGGALHDEIGRMRGHFLSRTELPRRTVGTLEVRRIGLGGIDYVIRGSYIGLNLWCEGGTLLISLERLSRETFPDEELSHRFRLTRREIGIARMLADGRSNVEIAAELHISVHTARNHVKSVMRKLGAKRQGQIARLLLRELQE